MLLTDRGMRRESDTRNWPTDFVLLVPSLVPESGRPFRPAMVRTECVQRDRFREERPVPSSVIRSASNGQVQREDCPETTAGPRFLNRSETENSDNSPGVEGLILRLKLRTSLHVLQLLPRLVPLPGRGRGLPLQRHDRLLLAREPLFHRRLLRPQRAQRRLDLPLARVLPGRPFLRPARVLARLQLLPRARLRGRLLGPERIKHLREVRFLRVRLRVLQRRELLQLLPADLRFGHVADVRFRHVAGRTGSGAGRATWAARMMMWAARMMALAA